MRSLSSWIDLDNLNHQAVLTCLLGVPGERLGVYQHLRTTETLLKRLATSQVVPVPPKNGSFVQILQLCGIDTGINDYVSREHLLYCTQAGLIDPNTPVHLHCKHANLCLFLDEEDVPLTPFTHPDTYLALDPSTRTPWFARIGPFIPPNVVYMQDRLHGKTSTLAKTLSLPYLRAYNVVPSQTIYTMDLPQ